MGAADASISLDLDAKALYGELQNITAKFVQFAQQTEKTGNNIGGGFGSNFGKSLTSAFSALGAGAAIKGIVEYGDHLQDLSERFGVSAVNLQRFGNAAEKNGSSLEAVAAGFNKLEIARSKALGGNEGMIKSFAALGVTFDELKSSDPDEIMLKIGAGSMNAADMVKVLGRGCLELRPTLAGLADGTIEFGQAISDLDVARLDAASDAFKQLKEDVTIFGGTFVSGFISSFQQGVNSLVTLLLGLGTLIHTQLQAFDKLVHGDFKGAKNQFNEAKSEFNRQVKAGAEANADIAKGPKIEKPRFGLGAAGGDAGETDDEGNPNPIAGEKKQKKEAPYDFDKEEKNFLKLDEIGIKRSNLTDDQKDEKIAESQLGSSLVGHALAVDEDEKLEQEVKVAKAAEELETSLTRQAAPPKPEKAKPSSIKAELDVKETKAEDKAEKRADRTLSDRGKLSLEELASSRIIGGPGGQARAALREEEAARKAALRGDLEGSLTHKARADEIKAGIDVLKDSEKENFKDSLDRSEVLKAIEKNTSGTGANK